MTTFMPSSESISNLCASGDLGFVETKGHSSRFIQVLDESMCVVREDLTDWLQRYLFSTVDAPPIDAPFLLFRLRSGLWLSRLAYKLQLSVLQKSSQSPPPQKHVLKEKDYNFLRGAVSNQNLRKVSKTTLPPFPQTLVACAGLPLGQPDVCPYSLSSDAYSGDVTTSSSSAYSSSDSPEHSYPHTEPSKPRMRIADQWAARDNVSCFIQWCKDLGIPQTVLFETTGLVHRTEEKNVLLTLMELARIASRFGLTDLPELVRMEREIDALEEAFDNKMNEEHSWIELTSDPSCVKNDLFVDEGIDEDHDEKSDVFILEPGTGIDLSDSDHTPKPSAPVRRLRSVEATPPITRNRLSRSICTSPLDKLSEKHSLDRTGITTAEFSSTDKSNLLLSDSTGHFVDSTDDSGWSADNTTVQDGFTESMGPCGDVGLMDTSHDQEQRDTSSSGAGLVGSSENRPMRSGDPFVEDQVAKKLALCTCCNRLRLQRLEEGRYRLNGRIYYFRRFRNHVMVRIGGGWLTLDAFLSRHDPCRRGKCVPMNGANSQPPSVAGSLPEQHHATNSNSGKPPASMSTSMVVLRRRPSKKSDESLSDEKNLVPTLEDNQISKPLIASHPNLLNTPTRSNLKTVSNSTSRLPIPPISSRRASASTDHRQQADTYLKVVSPTSRLNLSVDDLSQRRSSECLSRNSSSIVNRPSLYYSPRSSVVPKNSSLIHSRIPLAKQSNPDLTTIGRTSRPPTPPAASVVPDRTKGSQASHRGS